GVIPAGLGARDSLRLEMGYILYGNDVDEQRTPLEAGLSWVVKLDKGEFIGRAALQRQKEEGVRQRLVGFVVKDRAFPRHGYEVRHQGEPIGEVTSGTVSPTLNQGLGLAYVAREFATPGTPIEIVIRNRPVPAEVVRPPFYKVGSVRMLRRRKPDVARIRLVVLTVSDGCARGTRDDRSGAMIEEWAAARGMVVAGRTVVPDDAGRIAQALLEWTDPPAADVILTTGGTGFTSRDVTPEATRSVIEREAPGIAEAIRQRGATSTPFAWLSRGIAGIRGRSLIVNLPGSPGGE